MFTTTGAAVKAQRHSSRMDAAAPRGSPAQLFVPRTGAQPRREQPTTASRPSHGMDAGARAPSPGRLTAPQNQLQRPTAAPELQPDRTPVGRRAVTRRTTLHFRWDLVTQQPLGECWHGHTSPSSIPRQQQHAPGRFL